MSGFTSRHAGHSRARKVWVCKECNTSYRIQVKRCACGHKAFSYFASMKEYKRGQELSLLEKAGAITELEYQPRFPLTAAYFTGSIAMAKPVDTGVTYVADFAYVEGGRKVVEDVKTTSEDGDDPVFKLKRKWFEACYGIELTVIR